MNNLFKKYPSIVGFNKKNVEYFDRFCELYPELKSEEVWYAYEKIHGSNLQFIVNDSTKEIVTASRNQVLVPGVKFHDWENVLDQNRDKLFAAITELKNTLPTEYGDVEVFHFFGELAGDGVQRGIQYHQEKKFYLFDIAIAQEGSEYFKFLPMYCLNQVANYSGLSHAPLLAYGKFDEIVSEVPALFISVINPDRLGEADTVDLNELPAKDLFKYNISEGYILRPNVDAYYNADNSAIQRDGGSKRIIFKVKPSAWDEVITKKDTNKHIALNFTKDEEDLIEMFSPYFNENRFASVMSKEFDIDKSKFKQYAEALMLDAREAYIEDLSITEEILDGYIENNIDLKRVFNRLCGQTVGKNLNAYLVEEF